MKYALFAAALAASLVTSPAQAEVREVLILGKLTQYKPNNFPAETGVNDEFSVSLLYDTSSLDNTGPGTEIGALLGGKITIGSFSYDIGSTNTRQLGSRVMFEAGGGIDINFGARLPEMAPATGSVALRDYVHIRLLPSSAANPLFDSTGNVFTWNSAPAIQASYLSFVVDRLGYDVRGNPSQITFDVPADAAPVNAVPEPATWAMMIGGFGLVGGAMRRRSRNVTYA